MPTIGVLGITAAVSSGFLLHDTISKVALPGRQLFKQLPTKPATATAK